MMKIMLVILNTYGGMIHYTSQIANFLSKKGKDVVVIAPVGIVKKNFAKKVKIIELKLGDTIKNFFINTLILTRPIKFLNTIYKENPEVIHFIEWHMWASLFLPLLRKFPIVTTIHDPNPHVGTRKFDKKIARYLHQTFSDVLIVHCEKAKQELNDRQKCFVIPHGDYSFFLKYNKNSIKEEKNTILFFGRIEDYKGLKYLIESVNIISNYYPKIKLIIAGAGDFRKYNQIIEKKQNYEIHNRFVPDEEVSRFFQRAALVVLPYIEASQTGIIPIAYAFKKPVVVTNVGCVPEVVEEGKTGFIVPPKNPKALAKAIVKLLKDDKLTKRMGENAYKKMKRELSWDMIAEKTIEVYKEAINGHKNKRRKT